MAAPCLPGYLLDFSLQILEDSQAYPVPLSIHKEDPMNDAKETFIGSLYLNTSFTAQQSDYPQHL